MANYGASWPLPPSFMPCDSSFKGAMPTQSSTECLLTKESPHCEAGLPEKQGTRRDDSILYVTIHQAKHIHNICIYGNQDVYAKFLLTHCQDAVYPTRPVKAGGQNPVFNQSLEIPISGHDSVLKCELWMMSCARNYLEDQLLGFVLVPLKTLYGKGKQTCEYCLTSTDLFYTPAGTVHLSLSILDQNGTEVGGEVPLPLPPSTENKAFCCPPCPDFPEVMMDCGQQSTTPASMSKVEFLDLEAAAEDQHLVSMYYKLANSTSFDEEGNESSGGTAHSGHMESTTEHASGHGSLLSDKAQAEYVTPNDPPMAVPAVHIHASSVSSVDDEMVDSPREEDCMHVPPYFSGLEASSGMQDMVSDVTINGELIHGSEKIQAPSTGGLQAADCPSKQSPENAVKEMAQETGKASSVCQTDRVMPYSAPLVNASVEPDATINQEHFVDLYLKSMQQFTDKIADMKFSFDINSQDLAALRSVQVDRKAVEARKKEGSKLYYGSRAFY